MRQAGLSALISLLLVAGCAMAPEPTGASGPKPLPANVKVYAHVPTRPYRTLGPVSFEGLYPPPNTGAAQLAFGDRTDFLGELQSQAAALGADAVILKEKTIYDPQEASGIESNDMGSGRRMRLAGIAIKFLEPAR